MKKNLLLLLFYFLVSIAKGQTDTLTCQTFGNPINSGDYNGTGYYINGTVGDYGGCDGISSLMIAIIDSSSCEAISTCNNDFGQQNQFTLDPGNNCTDSDPFGTSSCGNRAHPWKLFKFRFSNPAEVNSLIQLLGDISNGDYILAYTWLTYSYSTLPLSFKNAFISLGSIDIATIPDSVPYIFFCKKGTSSSVHEIAGVSMGDTLTLQVPFQCLSTSINELIEEDFFHLMPNPSNGIFHFQFKEDELAVALKIMDLTGREIYSQDQNIGEVNISDAPDGIYFYQVSTLSGKTFQGKILKN